MTPAEFRAWRAARLWTQAEAAEALDMSISQIADYESGRKRGTDRAAPVPRVVELACKALARQDWLRAYAEREDADDKLASAAGCGIWRSSGSEASAWTAGF